MSDRQQPYSLKKVFKGASIFSAGDVLIKASGFFLIPLYTRVLTPADFGVVGYLQVFLRIATVIVAFGFRGAQTRYYYENKEDTAAMGRFIFTINIIPLALGVLILTPLTVFSMRFNWGLGNTGVGFFPYMIFTLWTVVLQVFADNAMGFYRARQQFAICSALQITRFFSITGFTLLLILGFDMGALGRIAGLFAGTTLFVLISSAGYIRQFVWRPSKEAFRYAVAFGAPVVVHLLAASIHNSIDRVMLERYISMDDLGIYSLAFSIGNTLSVFISSFNKAFQPSYYQLMSEERRDKEHQVIKAFKVWSVLMTGIASFGIIFGAPFLKVFAGPRFLDTIAIFPWIILAIYMSSFYYFFSSPIFYFKRTRYLPVITGGSAILNISLNFILIPRYGMFGAALSTVFSHVLQSVLALYFGNRLYRMKWPYLWIFGSIAVVCGSLFLAGMLWV